MDLFHDPKFHVHVDELMKKHRVPGLAIAMVHDKRIDSRGYGHASLNPLKKCTAETLFDIASASKGFTAASVGLMVDDNVNYPEIHYDTVMSSILPEFVMPGKGYTEQVTVEDVLSHRTGMPRQDFSYMGVQSAAPDNARSVTRNLRHLPIRYPIRSQYLYCNMMYTVATHLVETKSDLSFSAFLEHHFFRPLDMSSTSLQPKRARDRGFGERIAMGHIWDENNNTYIELQPQECPEGQGAGSIITSVNDDIKWIKAMLHQEGPISQSVYQGLTKARICTDPSAEKLDPFSSPPYHGAGWEVYYYRGRTVVGHSGRVSCFGAHHFFLPEFKFGSVVLGNAGSAYTVANVLAREIIDQVLLVPADERPDWDAIKSQQKLEKEGNSNRTVEKSRVVYPNLTRSEPQKMPLSAYTGEYWNPGYHGMVIQIKDGRLYVDATDRSALVVLKFEHVCEQTSYIVHVHVDAAMGGQEVAVTKAEFRFENDRAVKVGLLLEELPKSELIWLDRVQPQ